MASRFLVLSTAPPSSAAAHSLYSSSLNRHEREQSSREETACNSGPFFCKRKLIGQWVGACLRNWTAEKPAWPSKTAAKEKPSRREPVRSTTSSSISSRAPCSLALPHRMASSSEDGGPAAATPPAAAAWHRAPRPQHRIPPTAPAVKAEGGSRGTRGLSSAIFRFDRARRLEPGRDKRRAAPHAKSCV
jgi:hypothetical protein